MCSHSLRCCCNLHITLTAFKKFYIRTTVKKKKKGSTLTFFLIALGVCEIVTSDI